MSNFWKGVLWFTLCLVAGMYTQMVWDQVTQHDNDGIPCEAVGVYTTDSGAPVILRECQDGSIVVDYPHIGE